eukprot:GSMAST32.ASY1.ANO1.647.1 assembled CDS
MRLVNIRAFAFPGDYSEDDRNSCARNLWLALSEDGFVIVSGTGVPTPTVKNTLQAASSFFALPEEYKSRCVARDRARRGYCPSKTENFASLVGNIAENDVVEKYRFGPSSSASKENTKNTKNTKSELLQANMWPPTTCPGVSGFTERQSKDFKTSVDSYYKAMTSLSSKLLCAIAIGYKDALSSKDNLKNCTSILTMNGYLKCSKNPESNTLIAAHTDVGVITILCYDDGNTGKLQIKDTSNNTWVDACCPATAGEAKFIINVGDCLSDFTLGRLQSTLHRVVANIGAIKPRHSLAFFVGLDGKARTRNIDGKPLTYSKWRKKCIKKSMRVLKMKKTENKKK